MSTLYFRSVYTWQRARVTAQRNGKLLEIVVESKTEFYFPERFLQLVSQRFQPLPRATCLAMVLRNKLHENLHSTCNSALRDIVIGAI